jgi:hypothetical protein
MKRIGLAFLMLGCAALAVASADTGRSVSTSQQAPFRSATDTVGNHSRGAGHMAQAEAGTHVGKPSDDQQNTRKLSGNKSSASIASPSKAKYRTEVPNGRRRSASRDPKNSDGSDSVKSAGAAQNGLARSETTNHAASNRMPGAVKPAVPSLGNVRHGGPYPAIIGGAGNSNSKNTAALDGTHMNRRRTGN